MASITERKGRYLVRVRQQGFPTITKTFTTRAAAATFARRTEVDMETGRWVGPSTQSATPTLAQAIDEYQRTVAVKMKGADDYAYRFVCIAAQPFAAKAIDAVTPFDLSAWRDDLAKTRLPSTVVRLLALLSGVFTWAVKERGWCDENPMAKVRRPRVNDARTRTFSPDEWRCLVEAASTSKARWLAPALTVLVESAMRRGELFALRRNDIDYQRGVARLHETKAGGGRDVPLSPAALQALRELESMAPKKADAPLLPVGDAGSVSTRFVVTVRRARAAYLIACDANGQEPDENFLADVRLHDVRHQSVTRWAATGGLSLPELMAVSGHRTPRMLVRYTNLKAQDIAGKLAALAAPSASAGVGMAAVEAVEQPQRVEA